VQASAQHRRRALRAVFIGAATGAVVLAGFGFLWPEIERWITSDAAQVAARARTVMLGAALLLLTPLGGIAIWLWRLGTRTLVEDRFPPPGVAAASGTLVLTGDAARRRARFAQALAILAVAAAAALALLFWRLSKVLPGNG